MEFLPCPYCSNKNVELIGNPLCAIYGAVVANVYCNKCQAQAPQKTWNSRDTNNFCSYCQPERTLTHVVNDSEKMKARIKYLEKVMRAEAALILKERFSIEDESQVERLRLSACRLVDAVKYK